MKFAHLADCHIGGWKEPELRELGIESFRKAIDICIKNNVGFVLISGDLFNTALPPLDLIKETAIALNKLKEKNIDVYIIPGSHDFSPSGKTMLDLLEESGLMQNVVKYKDGKLQFTIDKTNTKITGLLGKKGGLEKTDYAQLDKTHLENEDGFKIFMFHTALEEFKPKELENVEGLPVATLPKNFNYYAGGHVHYIFNKKEDNSLITFPGALFPNNFKELEEFKHGGFYIVDDQLNFEYVPVKLKDVINFKIDITDLTPEQAEEKIIDKIKKEDLKEKIVTLRIFGILRSGKPSMINFRDLIKNCGAYVFLKNTNKLTTKEFEELKVDAGGVNDIEEKLIEEIEKGDLVRRLINTLSIEKNEGEKNADFEKRVINDTLKIIKDDTKED